MADNLPSCTCHLPLKQKRKRSLKKTLSVSSFYSMGVIIMRVIMIHFAQATENTNVIIKNRPVRTVVRNVQKNNNQRYNIKMFPPIP